MKHLVIAGLTVALAMGATTALAYESKTGGGPPNYVPMDHTMLMCDEDLQGTAWWQGANELFGNGEWDLGQGAQISAMQFIHYGWVTLAGPYDYNLHLWDDVSCTAIAQYGPFQAADAYSARVLEEEDLCPYNILWFGLAALLVEPMSCYDPTDCYPCLEFDDLLGPPYPTCGRRIDRAAPDCSPMGGGVYGAYNFRIELDGCSVPVEESTWGSVKSMYN